MNAILSLQKEIEAELLAAREAAPEPTSTKIEIPQASKKFQFPDGRVSEQPFDAVIVDWRWNNSLFDGLYNPNKKTKPICFARSKNPKVLTPAFTAEKPQCEDCSSCPHNQWGSKGNGKACKNTCVLALIPPDATDTIKPLTLTIPPASLKHWTKYLNKVTNQLGKIPMQLVTKIGFDPNTSYACIVFAETGFNDNVAVAFSLRDKAAELLDRGAGSDVHE